MDWSTDKSVRVFEQSKSLKALNRFQEGEGAMSRLQYTLLVLIAFVIAGCGRANQQSADQPQQTQPPQVAQQAAPPPAPESAPQVAVPQAARPAETVRETARPVRRVETAREIRRDAPAASAVQPQTEPAAARSETLQQPAAAQAPAPPPRPLEPKFFSIPQGTNFRVRLQQPLDTGINKPGDKFRAILDQAIEVDGVVVAPRGSVLEGELPSVVRSGRVQGRASMTMKLVRLLIENQSYPLETETKSFAAESSAKKDATKVGVGAGIGAVIGAIAGGGKGAAIGAAVGAGAGGATVAATRGDELRLEAEHKLTFVLEEGVRVQLQ